MKRLCGIILAVAALCACGGSAKNAAPSSTTHPTFASSSTDYTAYCAVMKRTDVPIRANQGNGFDPAGSQLAIEAENERVAKSPPELASYWATYMGGGHNIDAVNYLKDWTYTHCGFEPAIGG